MSKIRALAWWDSLENSAGLINPGLLCPHMVERERWGWGEKDSPMVCLLILIKTQILLDLSPTFMTSFNLNYFLTPNIVIHGIRALTYEPGGGDTYSYITFTYDSLLLFPLNPRS